MRIAHVLTRLLRAGSEENTITCCLGQAAAGHDVYLIHGREVDPRQREALQGRLHLIEVASLVHPLAPLDDASAVLALRRVFQRLRPDIVHTHQSKAGILGRLAAGMAQVPTIVHGVHILPFVNVGPLQRAVYLAAERLVMRFTDAFIDVSRGVQEVCVAHGVGDRQQHHVVHSGFDLQRFRRATPPDDWRDLLHVPSGAPKPPTIVMLAALEERKRHQEFIATVPRMAQAVPGLRVLMAGEGPHRAEIEHTIAALGLQDRVLLSGFRNDPERLIALADICVLTSNREGLPRVVMQYSAAGKPAVVTDLPGLDEVLTHEVNGIVRGQDDFEGVADTIVEMFSDSALMARLSEGARSTDLGSWEQATMVERVEQVYRSALAAGWRVRPAGLAGR